VLKKAHAPPEKHRELVNDSEMHQKVCTAFEGLLSCKVPKFMEIIHPTNDEWWKAKGSLIPESELQVAKSRERTPILASERIWPLPGIVRKALITTFCSDLNLQGQARKDKKNRDCLVRIYLGARNHMGQFNSSTMFSLRNFPLSLEKMEVLDIDKLQLASSIAEALATLHWGAKIDARDVEFVLGMAPQKDVGRDSIEKQAVCVWVLDFNQCADISMDENGCVKAAEGFWDNDPYYPRPRYSSSNSSETLNSVQSSATNGTSTTPTIVTDEELWEFFKERYLEFSGRIIEKVGVKEWQALPEIFIRKVIEMGRNRLDMSSLSLNSGPPKGGSAPGGNHNRKRKGPGSRRNAADIILEESSI
jgi:Zinc finger protein